MTTTSNATATVTLPSETQILITRRFDAPRHLVFRVWSTPDLVQKWWAGKRGTTTTVDMDFRVGGTWRYVLTTNDGGGEIAFHGEYREIVPDQRVVWTEHFEGPWPEGEPVVNTLTLIEQGDSTILELLSDCPDQEVRDMIVNSGMESGMQEQMVVIAELAAALGTASS
jgi:uncharacterized protein YndB with AHSA1/START domain